MNNITTLQYWGYLHIDGTTHTKRLHSEEDIIEAHNSPFVKEVVGPFDMDNIADASDYIIKYFNKEYFGFIDEKGNQIITEYDHTKKGYFISIIESGLYYVEDIMAPSLEMAKLKFQKQLLIDITDEE